MAGMSHELRTPLNAIYGFAQILEGDRRLPANRHEAVRAIRRSSEHLAGLIEGLLDISKIEAGRLELNRVRVRLPDLLHQITEIFGETARENNIRFDVQRLTPLPEWVMIDEKRLRQILINLLANAFRYTTQGEVVLRIGWRNQVARIEVEDTGIGIAPEDMERIWQPFERGQGVVQRGSGLGLTITRLLVDVLGGQITVRSTPGKGSCFTLQIYLSSAPARSEEGKPERLPRDHVLPLPSYAGRRRTIVIVDDDATHLELMETYLSAHGFNPIVLASAEAAEDLLRSKDIAPDLFLIDIDMPGKNGWDLLRWLRSEGGQRATPVIVLSGHALEARNDTSELVLHDAFIAKPCILDDLLARIDGLLKLDRTPHPDAPDVSIRPPVSTPPPRPETLAHLRALAHQARMKPFREALEAAALPQPLLKRLRDALAQADFERILNALDTFDPTGVDPDGRS